MKDYLIGATGAFVALCFFIGVAVIIAVIISESFPYLTAIASALSEVNK